MRRNNDVMQLEVRDLIRMNQLVRGRIDFDGFVLWHNALSSEEQSVLIAELCQFAYQAGVDDVIFAEALTKAQLQSSDPVVVLARKVQSHGILNVGGLCDYLKKCPAEERFIFLKIFVHLFGIAEGRVFQRETKLSCNHWWHRDLLDDRVVQDILSNPKFYTTAMKDDDKIRKSPTRG